MLMYTYTYMYVYMCVCVYIYICAVIPHTALLSHSELPQGKFLHRDSPTWESFTRSGLKLESVHQESPHSDIFRKRATKPLLNQRQRQKHLTWAVEKKNWTVAQWSKVLFSDESKFCISFGNQGPRVWRKSGEAQNPCCLKSSVKFPQSVMIWAAMSSAGVGPLCFLKSSQRSHLPGNFRALHASFCWQALWRCWFHFPAGLGTCPHCQRYQKLVQWPWCYCAWLASKLAWPEPHRESMGYCQEEDERHQTQQCRWPEGHCQRNLGFHTTSAVPQTDHLHATPNWGSNWSKRRPYQVLSTYTVNEHTFQKANNSLKMFFLLVLWSILICWDLLVGFC